jgi:hypothetical protein
MDAFTRYPEGVTMRAIGTAFRNLIALTLLGGIASAVAAAYAKGRMLSTGAPADDEVDLVAIYTGLDFQSTAPALRQATVTTWYGGTTLDLRGATLDPAGATLNVRAIFGGARLVIPEAWPVELRTMAIAGGVGDVRDASRVDPSSPTLTIAGFAIFGGVGIVSDAPDLDREDEIEEPVFEPVATPA